MRATTERPHWLRLRGRQRGLGMLGSLVVIAILIAGGYYAYKNMDRWMPADQAPSCKAALNSCIGNCRKSYTEAPDVQACQERCARTAEACERKN